MEKCADCEREDDKKGMLGSEVCGPKCLFKKFIGLFKKNKEEEEEKSEDEGKKGKKPSKK